MAISPMQKVEVFGHQSEREEVLAALQEMGVMEVRDFGEAYQGTDFEVFASDGLSGVNEIEERLAGVRFGIAFLKPYVPKQGFLDKLSSKRVKVSPKEYREVAEEFDYKKIISACYSLSQKRDELSVKLERLIREKDEVLPWSGLDFPVDDVAETEKTVVRTFCVRRGLYDKLVLSLQASTERFHMERVHQGDTEDTVFLVYLQEERDLVEPVLQGVEHRDVSWEGYTHTPREIVRSLDRDIADVQKEQKQTEKETVQLVRHRPRLLVLEDYLNNELERRRVGGRFGETDKAFMIQGWTQTEDFPRLQERIEKAFRTVRVVQAEPVEGEHPPIVLQNKKFSEPFEVVTDLYGSPSYFELDPTPALAPFFVLLLAMCITDAGYGLTMAALSFFALKKFRVGKGTRKLLSIILYSGLATIGVGILTGGYFGIDFSGWLPSVETLRNQLMVVDPLKDPVLFMVISFGVGFLHITFGIVLEFYDTIKRGKLVDGLLDQVSWIALLWGLVIFAVSKTGLGGAAVGNIGKWTALLGAGVIVLFQGRKSKNPVARVGAGLYSLYGITGYLGDVLSYSRIMAMGMATGVIAMVVNTFVGMMKGIPVVGVVLAALVFIFGHLFNILINLVSGFIHTMRLQFVEFFQKFLEGGGKPFSPFQENFQHVLISSGDVEKK